MWTCSVTFHGFALRLVGTLIYPSSFEIGELHINYDAFEYKISRTIITLLLPAWGLYCFAYSENRNPSLVAFCLYYMGKCLPFYIMRTLTKKPDKRWYLLCLKCTLVLWISRSIKWVWIGKEKACFFLFLGMSDKVLGINV